MSNRQGGGFETTLFAYDVTTGIEKFVREFSRNNNKMVVVKLLENYNDVSGDSSSVLILSNNTVNKKIMLLNVNNGNVKWEAVLNSFPTLGGVSVRAWKDGALNNISMRGDQDLYTVNAETGEILFEKRFDNRFEITTWGNNILQIVDQEVTLWDPMAKKVWTYFSDSHITSHTRISTNSTKLKDQLQKRDGVNNLLTPSVLIGTEGGLLRALNFDGGWFNWNIERWVSNVGDSPKRIWTHNLRVFCLTEQDSLFTLDINSGKIINSIRLDQNDYWLYHRDKLNNVMIMANDHFILGIDPLNGDQLWKVKEANKTRQIRLFNNNLFVTNKVAEDSIIIINNYNRDNGNLIWSEILDRNKAMQETHFSLEGSNLWMMNMGDRINNHPGLFHYIADINDLPYLITKSAIQEIDVSSHPGSNLIETSMIKLNLARAYYIQNNIHFAIAEYNDLVRHYDQMNMNGHKELSDLYINSSMNREAINALLNYHNLLLPGSKEASSAINSLKEITKLSWVHNTYLKEDEESNLLSDKNIIYELSNKNIELYRAGSGALLGTIDLDDNIIEIIEASVEHKNLLILIARLEIKALVWGKDKIDMLTYKRDNTQLNLITIKKSSGEIVLNKKLVVPPDHDIKDLSFNNNNIFIESFFDENLYVWHYDINNGQTGWNASFSSSEFYYVNDGLQSFFYNNTMILPLEDKIVFIDFITGEVINEFIDDLSDEIVVCNNNGLVDSRLIIVVDNVGDYEYLTLDLDNNGHILMRGEFESEAPKMSAIIDDCFFEIDPTGYIASYCVTSGGGALQKKWDLWLNWLPNYLGAINGNLVLLDRDDNTIVELDSKTGIQKNSFPLLWPSLEFNMTNKNIVIGSNRLLYVVTM